jgi:hypothetical protein
MAIAHHLPRRVAYFAYIRIASWATIEAYPNRTPDEVSILNAMQAYRLDMDGQTEAFRELKAAG